jgi:(E)-4-hydroxy-3-methylbut-2-enyl-diphosphate synthase
LKSSNVRLNYDAHLLIAGKMDYPIHIGITEAGTIERGKVKSAAGIGALLLAGIGDTIRVSFTGDPVSEVLFAKEILKAIGIRDEGINLISCPTCGRCGVDLARFIDAIEGKISSKKIQKPFTAAIMGCEVNGPGEAREADIGIAFGKGKAVIFQDGKLMRSVPVFSAEKEFLSEIDKLIKAK